MTDKMIEVTGETIDDAIKVGLDKLGVERKNVSIEVIDEGSLGVLGIGKRDAVVQLQVLDADADAVAVLPEADDVAEVAEAEEETADEVVAVSAAEKLTTAAPVVQRAAPPDDDEIIDEGAPTRIITGDGDDTIYLPTQEELEEESAEAKVVLRELLDVMGLDGEIGHEILPEDERGRKTAIITLDGTDELDEALVGPGGTVLYSFQFILRGMVSQRLSRYTSFLVDVNEFRDRRVLELISQAKEETEKALRFGRPMTLDPMPAHERRIVHMTLRDDDRIVTKSKGEDNKRRVRIIPKDYKPRPRSGGYNDRRGGGYRGGGNRNYNNRNQGGGYRGGGGGYNNRNQGGSGYNNRNQGGGGYRGNSGGGGYNNRNQGSGGYRGNSGGGGYNDRNQGGGGYRGNSGGGGYNNRNQGSGYNNRNQGGGGYNNRNQGGGYNNRDQGSGGYRGNSGGGGGYNDRNQGGGYRGNSGGGGYNDRNQGGGYRGNSGGNRNYNDRNQGGGNRNPNERNPNVRNPNERNPNERNPNVRNPNERNPNERNPNERSSSDRDYNRRDDE